MLVRGSEVKKSRLVSPSKPVTVPQLKYILFICTCQEIHSSIHHELRGSMGWMIMKFWF
uniref:Uncharacterized protein n=1 Tax=Arundo donax TaxID=35708 RepID=A0A0A9HJN1_ARUDO